MILLNREVHMNKTCIRIRETSAKKKQFFITYITKKKIDTKRCEGHIITIFTRAKNFLVAFENFEQMIWTISMILKATPNKRPFASYIFSGNGPLNRFMQHEARKGCHFKKIRQRDLLVLVHLPDGFCFNRKKEICVRRGFFRKKVPVEFPVPV